jgi:hypothetical protein
MLNCSGASIKIFPVKSDRLVQHDCLTFASYNQNINLDSIFYLLEFVSNHSSVISSLPLFNFLQFL